jgi:hypothetical protein
MVTHKPKRYGDPSESYAPLPLVTMDNPASRALSTAAQALYPWLVWNLKEANIIIMAE